MLEISKAMKRISKQEIALPFEQLRLGVKSHIGLFTSLFVLCALGLWLGACSACAQEVAPDTNWPKDESVIPGKGDPRKVTDWWIKQYKSRRDLFWSRHAEKKGAVVFLGDSITELWEPRMEKDFAEWNVANCGIGGIIPEWCFIG